METGPSAKRHWRKLPLIMKLLRSAHPDLSGRRCKVSPQYHPATELGSYRTGSCSKEIIPFVSRESQGHVCMCVYVCVYVCVCVCVCVSNCRAKFQTVFRS